MARSIIVYEEADVKGVRYLVDESGARKAVVIDLKKHKGLWEDFFDRALAESRRNEPRETLAAVRKRLARRLGQRRRG